MSSIDDPQEEWEYRGRMPKPAVIRSNPLSWIIAFLKWLIWLFRRTAPGLQRDFGRIAQPTIEAKNRVLHKRPLIFAPGDAKLLTRANGEALPKYIRQINGGSAASPDNSDIRSTEKRPSLQMADNGLMSGNDLSAEDRYRVQVRKILERLPNIHALLDQAEAAGKQAWADFRFRLAHTQSPALLAYKGKRQAPAVLYGQEPP